MARVDLIAHLPNVFDEQALKQSLSYRRCADLIMELVFVGNYSFDIRLVRARNVFILKIIFWVVPGLTEEILRQPGRLEDASVARVNLVPQEPQLVQTQTAQHLVGDQFVFEQLHVAGGEGDMPLLSLNCVDQLKVLPLSNIQILRLVMLGWVIPIALVEILLKPRRAVETLAVNRFNLRRQNRPFRVRVLP